MRCFLGIVLLSGYNQNKNENVLGRIAPDMFIVQKNLVSDAIGGIGLWSCCDAFTFVTTLILMNRRQIDAGRSGLYVADKVPEQRYPYQVSLCGRVNGAVFRKIWKRHETTHADKSYQKWIQVVVA